MSIDIETLRDLPDADKLRVITQLWDDIAHSNRPVVVPADILAEASRRSEELQLDPSIAIDDEELWNYANGVKQRSPGSRTK